MSRATRRLLVGSVVILGLLPLACRGLVRRLERTFVPVRFREVVADPGADFTSQTGLPWPSAARVILVGDDHGGFQGEGEFYLIFEVDPETILGWLAGRPPWGGKAWMGGPVPREISGHCWFGTGSESEATAGLFRSEPLRYAARSRGPASIPWHNGNLLVIDRADNRVYLSAWDF